MKKFLKIMFIVLSVIALFYLITSLYLKFSYKKENI